MEKIHNNFVVVPIDKATGNVGFVCKRFYAEVLIRELGLRDGVSSTYKSIDLDPQVIIDHDVKTLHDTFKLDVREESKKLPHIYWLPKLHKNPIKFRFIIAAPDCSTKPLAKCLTKILKLFFSHQIENYNNKSYFYSHVKSFWVIQNNENVINSIKSLNKRHSIKTMSTFDFSTLYTKIPHSKLLEVLNSLVDFCFRGGEHKKLSVSNTGARWVTRSNKKSCIFDKEKVKEGLKFLMNRCHFTLGKRLFRQVIGIPMGSDPAPFMANLFLYHYENKWIKNLKKKDLAKARKFGNTFRFIDDLLTINDDNLFLENFKDIYPSELQLNLEGSGTHLSFLDLDLTLQNRHLEIKLFDKRDAFPFSIVRLPFASSNIPNNMFYSSLCAEILRIGRICSNLDNFIISAKPVIDRAFTQGAHDSK